MRPVRGSPPFAAVLALLFAAMLCWSTESPASTVAGRVLYRSGQPIPGVTVSLVHPTLGRSAPVATDSEGRFSISNVPEARDPFYLEVYWGRTLKYRKAVPVTRATVIVSDVVL